MTCVYALYTLAYSNIMSHGVITINIHWDTYLSSFISSYLSDGTISILLYTRILVNIPEIHLQTISGKQSFTEHQIQLWDRLVDRRTSGCIIKYNQPTNPQIKGEHDAQCNAYRNAETNVILLDDRLTHRIQPARMNQLIRMSVESSHSTHQRMDGEANGSSPSQALLALSSSQLSSLL